MHVGSPHAVHHLRDIDGVCGRSALLACTTLSRGLIGSGERLTRALAQELRGIPPFVEGGVRQVISHGHGF